MTCARAQTARTMHAQREEGWKLAHLVITELPLDAKLLGRLLCSLLQDESNLQTAPAGGCMPACFELAVCGLMAFAALGATERPFPVNCTDIVGTARAGVQFLENAAIQGQRWARDLLLHFAGYGAHVEGAYSGFCALGTMTHPPLAATPGLGARAPAPQPVAAPAAITGLSTCAPLAAAPGPSAGASAPQPSTPPLAAARQPSATASVPELGDCIAEKAAADGSGHPKPSPKSQRPQDIIAAEAPKEQAQRLSSRQLKHRTQPTTPADTNPKRDVPRLSNLRDKLDKHLKGTDPCVFRLHSNACADPTTPLWTTPYGTTYFLNTEATKTWVLNECSLFGGVIYDDENMLKAFIDDMCVELDSYDANGKYKITEKYCGCTGGPTKSSARSFHRRRDCAKRCRCNILRRTCLKHGRKHLCKGTGEWKRKDYCQCTKCKQRRVDNKERRAGPAPKKAKTARGAADDTSSA